MIMTTDRPTAEGRLLDQRSHAVDLDRQPFRGDDGDVGVGPVERGPALAAYPHPPSGHCKAAANARAATERPDPGGPVNSQACVMAVGSATALARTARASG